MWAEEACNEYEHGPGSCVTVNVRPAMVSVPERCSPVFAATSKVAAPDPILDADPDKVTQLTFETADQEHCESLAATRIESGPAVAGRWPHVVAD